MSGVNWRQRFRDRQKQTLQANQRCFRCVPAAYRPCRSDLFRPRRHTVIIIIIIIIMIIITIIIIMMMMMMMMMMMIIIIIIIIIIMIIITFKGAVRDFFFFFTTFSLRRVRRDRLPIKFDRVEIAFIVALLYWLKPLTHGGGEETGVPGENP